MPNSTFVFFDLGDTLIFRPPPEGQPYADAQNTLQNLRSRGYRMGLLSNQQTGTTVAQVAQRLINYGFGGLIEPELIVISSDHPDGNVLKPDARIFNYALQKAGLSQASFKTVFITETEQHINAARALGWRVILKNEAGCNAGELECVTNLQELLPLLPPLATDLAFSYAPSPKIVGGKKAVPIDIQEIDASLLFDAAGQSGAGEAWVKFRMGVHSGCPIFDLRRQVTNVELDGAPLPINSVSFHDFGGGSGAEMRVLDRVLAANSTHELRLTYDASVPIVPSGSGAPSLFSWNSGPRLTFGFEFTDLTPGRYLEQWIPANLIYDRFKLTLDIHIQNTAVPHVVISNGTVSVLGPNHWSILFPSSFNSFSPLLEVRAADRLDSATDQVASPVSGNSIQIEAWKPSGSGVNLNAQIGLIKNFLTNNETNVGRYVHGNRFVVFFRGGGMEYDGGTTTGTGPLRHEVFHSWFGRGLKPASQPDGWWDEAWTVYNDNGANSTQPFNFSNPPVPLNPRNPWVRVTNTAAYSDGFHFFRGVAAQSSAANLRNLMGDFYNQNRGRSVATSDLEAFLLSRTGDPVLVDAFHRFVYGFQNPSRPLISGCVMSTGTAAAIFGLVASGILPIFGSAIGTTAAWTTRRRNMDRTIGSMPAFATAAHRLPLNIMWSLSTSSRTQGVEFTYPGDFLPCAAVAVGFGLGPGGSAIVKARWPRALVPPAGTHACWMAAALTRFDHPIAGRHVWEHNNLAQKNLTIVDLRPNGWLVLPFLLHNLSRLTRRYQLELIRPPGHPDLRAALVHRRQRVFRNVPGVIVEDNLAATDGLDNGDETECGGLQLLNRADDLPWTSSVPNSSNARALNRLVMAPFIPGKSALLPVSVGHHQQLLMGLRLHVPPYAKKGEVLTMDLVKRTRVNGRVLGGISVEIHVV